MTAADTRKRVLIAALLILIYFLSCVPQPQIAAQTKQDTHLAAKLRTIADSWVPPDIDDSVPAVNGQESCSLDDVLAGAGRQVLELATNLDRYTATEIIEHQSVDRGGKAGKVQSRKFNYVIHMGTKPDGYMALQELRDPSGDDFPEGTATTGTPSLLLVFHPRYSDDFRMECEGLGAWRGEPAWQVRFEQREDRPDHLSAMVVAGRPFPVHLRGRAWITADSYHVAHLETDLARTIPEIGLRLEHMDVDYGPISFPARSTELWLPLNADLYVDLKGHRFYRRHRFANFTLFSVDIEQRFAIFAPTGVRVSKGSVRPDSE